MKKYKKKIPIQILETLEPILKKGQNKIKPTDPGDYLLKFVDIDSDSDFCFQVEQSKVTNSKLQILISHKPRSNEIIELYRAWIEFQTLEQSMKNWLDYIERYDKIKLIYDDPIEKKYQEEFYADFEIIEDDADLVSFNLDQQLFLDNYLHKVLQAIEQYNPEGNDTSLNEINDVVSELKNDLTKLTKQKVIKRLTIIWAKTRKVGIPILKEIYVQVRNELIKQLIQGQIEIK